MREILPGLIALPLRGEDRAQDALRARRQPGQFAALRLRQRHLCLLPRLIQIARQSCRLRQRRLALDARLCLDSLQRRRAAQRPPRAKNHTRPLLLDVETTLAVVLCPVIFRPVIFHAALLIAQRPWLLAHHNGLSLGDAQVAECNQGYTRVRSNMHTMADS